MTTPTAHAQASPGRPAVVVDGGDILSFGDLDRTSAALADHLHAELGLRPGGVVAWQLRNGVPAFQVAWAAQRSGLYHTAMSAHLKPPEVRYLLQDSGARVVFGDSRTLPALREAVGGLDLTLVDVAELPHRIAPGPTGAAAALEGADLLYTSGTTGRPKAVRKPAGRSPYGASTRRSDRMRELFDMHPGDVFFTPAPLYHAAPLRFTMAAHRTGATVVVLPRWSAEGALAALDRHRVTHSQWVPTHFKRLLDLPDPVRDAHAAPAHRQALHSGAPCPPHIKRAMIDWWGPILHEYYAGTESVGLVHATSEDWLARPGTVGRPYHCTVHIVGEDGSELPPGEVGTVYFESRRTLEYHNDPDKTARATHPQGWATMGDLGYLDQDGFLFLTDRRAFTIVSGGVNVYPREAEEVLSAHPAVAEAAVLGVPDEDLGERVHAVVALRDPDAASEELGRALLAHAREHLAHYKCPRTLDLVRSLPLTDSGKLAKAEVRDRLRDGTLDILLGGIHGRS